ncbi:MAG: flippase [Nitrospirae bacterium]|nr:flippase [Nitrospirota bacterium]
MTRRASDSEKRKEDNLAAGAKGGTAAFILQITALIAGFLNTVILARILGADGLGEVVLALSILSVAAQIAGFGMDGAMMRFVPSYLEKGEKAELKGVVAFAVWVCLIISFSLVILIFLFSGIISMNIFHSEGLGKLIPLVILAIPANAINVVAAGVLKGYKETFRALSPQLLISPLLKIIIFLLFALDAPLPLYAVAAVVISEAAAMAASLWFLYKKLGGIQKAYLRKERKKVLEAASIMAFSGLSAYLFTNADLWIVGMFMTTENVGIYGVVSKLVTLIAFSLGTFAAIIPPIISAVHTSGDREELRRVVSESTRWILSMSVPIILLLTVEGKFILELAYGKEFTAGFAAMAILAAGQLVNAGSGLVGYFLLMTGEHRTYMKITVFFGILNVILNFMLIPSLGIIGAALSTALCLAMVNISAVYIIYKKLSVFTLARGSVFDILFLSAVAFIYYLLSAWGISYGHHILFVTALTLYIGKSIINGDFPLHYLRGRRAD